MTDSATTTTTSDTGLGGVINKMPIWFQAGWLVAMTFGVPVLMVGFYLARDAGWIANPITAQLEQVNQAILRHDHTLIKLTEVVETQTERINTMEEDRILRCIMRAQNDDAKKACFPRINH